MQTSPLSRGQISDMSCAILRSTSDGDNLAPSDLRIVELAVNGMLNSAGIEQFQKLYDNATKPEGYTVPYLFGIEHLTIDHERSIRWKGVAVEHFDHGVWQQPGWQTKMREDAGKVAARCRQLEAEGIQPNATNVLDWGPPSPAKEQPEVSGPDTTPVSASIKALYWGQNDVHEFWESEDRELLILRNYPETAWTAHRNYGYLFASTTAEEAARCLNVTLRHDRQWKKGERQTYTLEPRKDHD